MNMASGKDLTGEQSQQWMRKRVMFQAVAIIIVVLILIVAGTSGARPAAAWSSSTKSTRAPATAAKPGSPTARGSARIIRSARRSATSTKPIRAIGIAIAATSSGPTSRAMLETVQNELFDLGADLATPGDDFTPSDMALRVMPAQVERLEREIDRMNEALEPLRSFILPGGGDGSAHLHLARAIARRAERSAVAAARERGAQSAGADLPQPAVGLICSSPRAMSLRAAAATFSGNRAQHAANNLGSQNI